MSGNSIAARGASLGLWLCLAPGAFAQEAAPTPKAVIYPGSIIRGDMLTDLPPDTAMGAGPFAETRAAVVGKMSHLTLLPGAAIPLAGLDNARLVTNGSTVQLVYAEGGLTIMTVGAALQDGAEGDVIKVRNSDSGVTVTGAVQSDGTVRVSG